MDRRSGFFAVAAVLCLAIAAIGQGIAYGQLGGMRGPGGGLGGLGEPAIQPVAVSAEFTAPTPGKPGYLFVTAKIKPGWHIYSVTQSGDGPRPTVITVNDTPGVSVKLPFRPLSPHESKTSQVFEGQVEFHRKSVTWYAALDLSSEVNPANLKITGSATVQACDDADTQCLPPEALNFVASPGKGFDVPTAVTPGSSGTIPSNVPSPTKTDNGSRLPWQPFTSLVAFGRLVGPSFRAEVLQENVRRGLDDTGLPWAIALAFFGGIILNFMPCVLPVIGLKVLSFVEQAGHDRRRALMLNVWYSAGLISVFLVLATLAAVFNLGWGRLYQYAGFNVALAAIVFAMGLAFLGVWEIPIPGFVGRGKAVDLAQQEGLAAAFVKGIITTLLATPCTGPFMGTALAWTVGQPPLNIFAVFMAIGVGMASPYLLIGAFPQLIRFLPRPGAWMETFKQIMGFVLMGTVVFILTFIPWSIVVPTVGMLFAIWLACWIVGRTTYATDQGVKTRAWIGAAITLALAWLVLFPGIDDMVGGRFAFGGLQKYMASKFDDTIHREAAIALDEKLRNDGYELVKSNKNSMSLALPSGEHTVLVAFTADWCLTCKTFEAQVLNTPEVRALVEQNRVTTLKADWTNQSAEEVAKFLRILGSNGVPVVAIFPAGDPNRPTAVLRGAYTQGQVLDALSKAGPSRIASR